MPPVPKDLTNERFGKLKIIKFLETIRYGGRNQPLWECRCDCGETIKLVNDQLPISKKQKETLMRSGRRLYDSCEKCRQKICPICGDRFSYSHTSKFCPKEDCQKQAEDIRMQYHRNKHKAAYAKDPTIREAQSKSGKKWYQNMKSDPERYELHKLRSQENRQRIKREDPERYEAMKEKWRLEQQELRVKARMNQLFNVSEELTKKIDGDFNE